MLSRSERWAYAVAWLLYLTLYAVAFIANGVPPGLAARNAFANVLPGVLLGALVLRLPRRLPWPEGRRASFFAIHFGLLIVFILLSAAGWVALVGLDALLFREPFKGINWRIVPLRMLIDLLIYCTLAGLAYARRNAAASREQAARAVRAEALRARAELEALRSQLNPHFILNTIHALMGLVRREPAVAEEALERLGERLRVSFEAAAPTLDCRVPSFALQTLVENAIRHAIALRAEGGLLAIRAWRVEDRLRIEVEDGGPGPLAKLPVESNGLGLRLLRERLAALYDGQAALSLEKAAEGLCAALELPARWSPEEP